VHIPEKDIPQKEILKKEILEKEIPKKETVKKPEEILNNVPSGRRFLFLYLNKDGLGYF